MGIDKIFQKTSKVYMLLRNVATSISILHSVFSKSKDKCSIKAWRWSSKMLLDITSNNIEVCTKSKKSIAKKNFLSKNFL